MKRSNWLRRRVTKSISRPHRFRPMLQRLEDKLAPTVFTVINTDASGPGSLSAAIFAANSSPNVGVIDEIHFNIPGAGVHTIFAADGFPAAMPTITDGVIIDGYTQPGASPNTLAVGDNAVLTIEINGSAISGDLFLFNCGGCTVRGLAITHVHQTSFLFSQSLFLPSDHNMIAGNFIGTDAGGLTYQAGDGPAITINVGSNNVIGGPAPADRNVIAPGSFGFTPPINIIQGTGNVIQGNY